MLVCGAWWRGTWGAWLRRTGGVCGAWRALAVSGATRGYSAARKEPPLYPTATQFEPVYSLPAVRYVSLLNRLKVYQALGSVLAVPGCAVLAAFDLVSPDTILAAIYIGLTGTALLSISTLMTKNVIGFIYISKDDTFIKISYVDYWGRRQDKIVPVSSWMPLSEMPSKMTNTFYFSPQLESSNLKLTLLLRFGKMLNPKKFSELLE